MIVLKTEKEIEIMAENAAILREILVELALKAIPGTTTAQLDRLAERRIREAGAKSAFKGYTDELHRIPYPATICASLNEEVVHGIPSEERVLQEGDILSIDLGFVRKGYYADAAITVGVGEVSEEAERMMAVAREALKRAVGMATIGRRLSDLSHAISSTVRKAGYYVVKEYTGHGIGRELHEDPRVLNHGSPGRGPKLRAGMVFCIEPMVKGDDLPLRTKDDGWTAVTRTESLSVHYEEMVAVTPEGPRVLTGWIWEEYCRRKTLSACAAR
ncbi:MAG TPA: type I methionyl aminopeptidase [Candidatus Acetothermia bacterium]|nr:type I methionyl aminopeptidase [Candidatus Acetothermia bacterium]